MVSTNPGSAKTSTKAVNRAEATALHKTRLLRLAEVDVSWVKAKRIAGHCELHAHEWDIMAAGVSNRLREVAEIVALVEAAEAPAKKRIRTRKLKREHEELKILERNHDGAILIHWAWGELSLIEGQHATTYIDLCGCAPSRERSGCSRWQFAWRVWLCAGPSRKGWNDVL